MDSLSGAPSAQAPVADVSQPKNRTLQQSQLNSLTADLGTPSGNASPTIPMGQGSASPTIAQGQTPFGGFGTATSWPQSLVNMLGGMASQWAPQNQNPNLIGTHNGPVPQGQPFGDPHTPGPGMTLGPNGELLVYGQAVPEAGPNRDGSPHQTTILRDRLRAQQGWLPPGGTGYVNQPGYSTPQLGGPWGSAITPPQAMQQPTGAPFQGQLGFDQAPNQPGPWGTNPWQITQQPGADQVVQPPPQQPPQQPPVSPQQPTQQPQQPPPAMSPSQQNPQTSLPQDRTPNGTPTPQSMGYNSNYQDSPADQAARRTVQAQQGEQEAKFMRESELAAQRGQDLYNSQLTGGNAYTSPYGANPNELNQMAAYGMNLPSANNPAYWRSLGVEPPSYLSNYYEPIVGDQFNSGVNVAPTANGGAAGTTAINPVMTNGSVPLPPMPPASDNPYAMTPASGAPFDPYARELGPQGTPALGNAFNTLQDQLNSGLINWDTQYG